MKNITEILNENTTMIKKPQDQNNEFDGLYIMINNNKILDIIIDSNCLGDEEFVRFKDKMHITYTQELLSNQTRLKKELEFVRKTYRIEPPFNSNHKYWCETYTSDTLADYIDEFIDFIEESIVEWIDESKTIYYESSDGLTYKKSKDLPYGKCKVTEIL